MRHMVRYEELATRVEERGEDAGDSVYVFKVVIGLRALDKGRKQTQRRALNWMLWGYENTTHDDCIKLLSAELARLTLEF